MDDELLESIKQVKAIVEENNKILHSMRSRARWGTIVHLLYWIVITGIAVGSFIYIEPYMKSVLNAYKSMQATQQKVNGISSNFNFDALKSYFSGTTTQSQ